MSSEHEAASRILSFPVEVLHLVFELLSLTELRALSLVNKELRTQVEPFLYANIQWLWQEAPSPPPITQLLRTISCRPHLAAYITNVYLDGMRIRGRNIAGSLYTIPISNSELTEYTAFVQGTGVPYSDRWIRELHQGTIDALLALLVAQLSNLRSLYLGPIFTRESRFVGMVLNSALCRPKMYRLPTFQHLRDVSFHRVVGDDGTKPNLTPRDRSKNTANVLPLFYLPNVQSMSVTVENPDEFTWPAAHLPDPSKLTSLDLTAVREAYLGNLLLVTPNLKTLRWAWYYDYGVEDDFVSPIVDLDGVAAALSHVRSTLTDLTITADAPIGGNEQFYPAVKMEGSLHALVDFDELKRLQIPLAFLVGFVEDTTKRLQDVVPRNIEFLTITDELGLQNDGGEYNTEWPIYEWTDSAVLTLLRTWLRDWRSCTPHLRGISILFDYIETNSGEWPPELRHQVMELGAQAGVSLDLVEWKREW
ncbi:hypothetical protein AtubIFM56815_008386 [Aspergillus tubingensis]|uniref:F-box domain-containing protein n=2 Tax=Aspergillus subgen. Circumdati TaxID=2720871 RepID=A0A117E0V6_ASPNG|nr:histidinol phosphate phosphatase, HisJ family protein [Aspergillus tubingensis]GAQ43073.1 hypothetical protein ANI_1_1040124 [Aspergillus niger]GFN10816.1 histidinol phosphate phosphatase, HisJ family protein [Aspergillus tubingensis]GLA61966.1 hypothetical protein AtubIFM54640_002499 [Aspergillus tubingensis]GLA84176.1 hypothetical protein AtubIFM56815_008386 [Aspergillus tubingensis]GLB00496.1 hypothetical protein AtubIFM57143_009548 [Aspergillus tubingensis]